LVTPTGRLVPGDAVEAIDIDAVTDVEFTTVIEPKLTPAGPWTRMPAVYPLPVRVTGMVAPRVAVAGDIESSVGAAMTVTHFAPVAVEPSKPCPRPAVCRWRPSHSESSRKGIT
jgi:hypothetical protein